jgi:hypothetical protein
VSITCELSAADGVQWFLTKESGECPRVCEGMKQLVSAVPGVLMKRPAPSLFVVKVVGPAEQCEVLVVPLAMSTMVWFEEFILTSLLDGARSGSWTAVAHVSNFLLCKPPCLRGCKDCTCVEQKLWKASGWRRAPSPELSVVNYIGWWRGITNAVGNLPKDGAPWLRCPCGCYGEREA